MAQGWDIDEVADTITFLEPPPAGVNNIVVKEFAVGAVGGTDSWALGAWSGFYGYPCEVEFFSDRLWWAGTPLDPQTVWGSQIGDYSNHGKSTPIVDSDAVSFTINARQVNAVQDLVPLDKMIILAKGGEFLMTGGQDEVITPASINIKPQSYRGTGGVQAKVVGDTAIIVQEQGSHVFDIGYRFEQDGYRPQDISVYADHLVEGYAILRMEWMTAPWSSLFFMRNDGKLAGCTYMPEQEVIGWHRHDSDGVIEDIVCLPGDKQTEFYAVVMRLVNGQVKRYIEQMEESFVQDPRDWFYVDSGLTYDGRNTTATTLTLTGGGAWTENESLTLTASAPLFVGVSDQGDGFTISRAVLEQDPATLAWAFVTYKVRLVITTYVSATEATVVSVGTVPAALRGQASADWVFERDTISGLGHLEGKEVNILSDASVHPRRVVTGGQVVLASPGGVVHVGLPYMAHLETLEVNWSGGQPLRDAKKLLHEVNMLVRGTRGIKVGTIFDGVDQTYLDEIKDREFENYGEPTLPVTGLVKILTSAKWGESQGKVHIVSDDPLPMEILAIIPKLMTSE